MTSKMINRQKINSRVINYLCKKYSFFKLANLYFNLEYTEKCISKKIAKKSYLKEAMRIKDNYKYSLILKKLI